MDRKNQPILEKILQEALKSVTIARRGSDRLAPRDYQRRVLSYRNRHNPSLLLDTFTYEPQIGDPEVRESVLDLLRSELEDFLHEDKTYTATFAIFGGLGSGSSIDDILRNLVKAAVVGTPRAAAKAFYDEIARGYLPFQEFFLLTGVRVESEVQVFDGISLLPLPSRSDMLPGYLPIFFGGGPSHDLLSKTILRVDMAVSPVLHRPDQRYRLHSEPDRQFKRAVLSNELTDFNPAKFFQALTFVGGSPAMPAMSWAHMSDEHIFGLRISPGSGFTSYSTGGPSGILSDAQVGDAAELYGKIMALPQEVEKSIQIPVDRWMKSKTHQGYVDKMIDLGIAMESFYLRGINEQLTFRFRLRGALHLGNGVEERKQLVKEFRDIYKYRSQAVHEGTLPEQVTLDGRRIPIGQYIEGSQELFRRSLMKVIDTGVLPDWERIELGGLESHYD